MGRVEPMIAPADAMFRGFHPRYAPPECQKNGGASHGGGLRAAHPTILWGVGALGWVGVVVEGAAAAFADVADGVDEVVVHFGEIVGEA